MLFYYSLVYPVNLLAVGGAGGFHVDHDIVHVVHRVADALLHILGNGVGFEEGDATVGLHVEGYHIHVANLPGAHAVRIRGAFHPVDSFENPVVDLHILNTVHQLDVGVDKNLYRGTDYEKTNQQAGHGVEYRQAEDKCKKQTQQHPGRYHHVVAHVLGVCRKQAASGPAALPVLVHRQQEFTAYGEHGYPDGYEPGHFPRVFRENPADGGEQHLNAGVKNHQREYHGRNTLGLLVTVNISGARFAPDYPGGEKHHNRYHHIGGRIDTVRQHGKAAGEDTGKNFERRKDEIPHGTYP